MILNPDHVTIISLANLAAEIAKVITEEQFNTLSEQSKQIVKNHDDGELRTHKFEEEMYIEIRTTPIEDMEDDEEDD